MSKPKHQNSNESLWIAEAISSVIERLILSHNLTWKNNLLKEACFFFIPLSLVLITFKIHNSNHISHIYVYFINYIYNFNIHFCIYIYTHTHISDHNHCKPVYSDCDQKCTGVGSLSLFCQLQGSNLGLSHCRWILYKLSHKGRPRILEWVAYPFSRGSSWPKNWTGVCCIAHGFFINWARREAH